MSPINVNVTSSNIFISLKGTYYMCSAELSLVPNSYVSEIISSIPSDISVNINENENWFFFNRLYVPKQMRGKGYASRIMESLEDAADANRINILNAIYPYGDLDMEDLTLFYCRFGFIKYSDGLVIREWSKSCNA